MNPQICMKSELKKLNMWLNVNRLALNVSKTNFVIFAPVNKPMKSITILINKQAISQKDYVKYLGVLIDSRLTFQQHISSIKKKVSRTIGIMYELRHFVNKKVLISIYYSIYISAKRRLYKPVDADSDYTLGF